MKTLQLSIIVIACIVIIGIILFAVILPMEPKKIKGLGEDTGFVTIGIQSYYFATVNDTMTTFRGEGVQELFHNVVFTFFPSPPYMGGFGSCYGISFSSDVKFSDGIHELLKVPVLETPCEKDYFKPDLSNHTNPQAGLAVYEGKVKLLVSTEDQTNTTNQLTSTKESIRIITEQGQSNGIGKNGFVDATSTIEIIFDNFKQTASPLIIQIINPHGIIYKVDNIPSSKIQPDGFYKYQIYIKGNESTMGEYKVVITHNNATASTSVYLTNVVP